MLVTIQNVFSRLFWAIEIINYNNWLIFRLGKTNICRIWQKSVLHTSPKMFENCSGLRGNTCYSYLCPTVTLTFVTLNDIESFKSYEKNDFFNQNYTKRYVSYSYLYLLKIIFSLILFWNLSFNLLLVKNYIFIFFSFCYWPWSYVKSPN